ncbi:MULTISPECIES: RNA polymerase sigma factor [Bacillaceae]|uniref:RNA polymerase sigma factor n=1 Tax=Evansella alkalicola TaxID=745819 RepID=A0ABS6K1A3_9BACI|nr:MULTISPECIES: RNA polymerase sigma factor [Bacillaceae]MBU9723222.1 RNA polymerase sigma factor [Bacillus alkalicola]
MDVTKLVKKAKKGNKEALLQLIMHQKDDYYRLAYTYLGNEHDALDAMEDTIVILYEKIGRLKKEDAFYSWSKTILVNCCKDILRKRKRWGFVEDMENVEKMKTAEKSTDNFFQQREQQLDIQQMLATLSEDQADAIRLKYLLDMDYESIAELKSVPIGTVKSRVFQGLKKLKVQMGGEVNEKY